MRHDAIAKIGNDVSGGDDVDEHRIGVEKTLQRLRIGGCDARFIRHGEPSEQRDELGVAARGRRPVDLDHRGMLRMEILREAGQADVHDLDRALEQVRNHRGDA